MIENKLISIVMNCYNGEKYLNQSIDSIINQDYQNWELIFFDNNSNDKSAQIFKSYKDKRFFYYKSDRTTNISIARNKAINLCKGYFIAFLDVDDYWDGKKLSKQIKFFDDDIDFIFTNFCLIKENKNKLLNFQKPKIVNLKFKENIIESVLENYEIVQSTIIIKKKILQNFTKIYDEKYHIIGDFELFLRLYNYNNIYHLKETLTYRRIHKKSESRKNTEKTLNEFEDFYLNNKKNIGTFSKKSELIFFNSNLHKRILFLLSKKKLFLAFKLFINLDFIYKFKLLKKIIILIIKKLINIF